MKSAMKNRGRTILHPQPDFHKTKLILKKKKKMAEMDEE